MQSTLRCQGFRCPVAKLPASLSHHQIGSRRKAQRLIHRAQPADDGGGGGFFGKLFGKAGGGGGSQEAAEQQAPSKQAPVDVFMMSAAPNVTPEFPPMSTVSKGPVYDLRCARIHIQAQMHACMG